MRLSTLLEMAQTVGVEADSVSLEQFDRRMVIRQPLGSLAEVLDTFSIVQRVLDRPEHLERVAYETILDCQAEGTSGVELRFSPSFVCAESGRACGGQHTAAVDFAESIADRDRVTPWCG